MTHTTPPDITPVRTARLRRGWSLRKLAEHCSVETGTPIAFSNIARVERGEGNPSPKLRAALAKLLDLDVHNDFPRKAA